MKRTGKILTGILYVCAGLLISCSDKENEVFFNDNEVIRLLSNDSSKSWIRKSLIIDGQTSDLSECDLSHLTTFYSNSSGQTYIIETIPEFCGGNPVRLDSGSWEVLEESSISDRIDRIVYNSSDGGSSVKYIQQITSLFLNTEEDLSGSVVQESFESEMD